MQRTLKLGTAYHCNRILRHVEEDMIDIVNHHMNTVVHMYTHNDMDRHPEVMKDIIKISEDKGLDVWVDNWGIDCGPGDKSYFCAQHPEAKQMFSDGSYLPLRPCYNHPEFRAFTKRWVEAVAEAGGRTLFWDEPHLSISDEHGFACACPTCKNSFRERFGYDMPREINDDVKEFRTSTIVDYFSFATGYAHECGMVNTGCIMLSERYGINPDNAARLFALPHFDNVGCDPYWVARGDDPTAERVYEHNYTHSKKLIDTAEKYNKDTHIWIQSYAFPRGREDEMMIAADAIYDAGARTILTWSFRGGESNDYRAKCPDIVWDMNAEIMAHLRRRYFDEMLDNIRKNRK